eukprot:314251-Pelagomonas_calceolata.AAC.1
MWASLSRCHCEHDVHCTLGKTDEYGHANHALNLPCPGVELHHQHDQRLRYALDEQILIMGMAFFVYWVSCSSGPANHCSAIINPGHLS